MIESRIVQDWPDRGHSEPSGIRTLQLDAGSSVDDLVSLLGAKPFRSRLRGLSCARVFFQWKVPWDSGVAGIIQRRRYKENLGRSYGGFGPTVASESPNGSVLISSYQGDFKESELSALGNHYNRIIWFQNTSCETLLESIAARWAGCNSNHEATCAELLSINNVKYAAEFSIHPPAWAIIKFAGLANDISSLVNELFDELGEHIKVG